MNKELTPEEQEKLVNDIIAQSEQLGEFFEKHQLTNQLAMNAVALLVAITLRPPKGTESFFLKAFINRLIEALHTFNNQMPKFNVILSYGKK